MTSPWIAGKHTLLVDSELEDLAFPFIHPEEYKWLLQTVHDSYATRMKYAERVKPMLLRALEKFDDIMAVMLPTLGEERQATYSPFLPISPISGRVLYVPMKKVDAKAGTITFTDEDGTEHALWEDLMPLEELRRRRTAFSERQWEALYQGNPRPVDSQVFRETPLHASCATTGRVLTTISESGVTSGTASTIGATGASTAGATGATGLVGAGTLTSAAGDGVGDDAGVADAIGVAEGDGSTTCTPAGILGCIGPR